MKTEPRQIAIKISLVVALFSGVLLLFVSYTKLLKDSWLLPLICSTIIFISTFFLINYALNRFIYKQIKLIYKNIHNQKLNSNKAVKSDLGPDMIGKINSEVEKWAKENRSQIAEFAEREKYRREFIGNISHELNTPLFSIEGYLSTLQDQEFNDQALTEKYIGRALRCTQRLIHLVQDLESISGLESGELDLYIQKINIKELANDVFESLEMQARKRDIQLRFNKEYKSPIWVMADKKRVRQVLVNLVTNAIYYGEKGGKVEIRFYDMDELLMTEVSDDGIGIGKNHLARLFERFYRVDRSRSRESGGTGLGLSIVKHILDAHGQKIHVRSTPNVGSTFSFTLKMPEPLY